MGDGWAALLGAVVGGLISLAGTLGLTRAQWRREERLQERERLRQNLYALQDSIDPLVRRYYGILEARWMRGEIVEGPDVEVSSAVMRLNMQSVRVGDDVLGARITAVLAGLARARRSPDSDGAFSAYREALAAIDSALERMGELLHTDARVELGDDGA